MRPAGGIIFGLVLGAASMSALSFRAAAGQQAPADSADLKQTVVVSYLEAPIEKDKNLLYCATFQLAWNEFRSKQTGRLRRPPPPVVSLEKKLITKQDLPEDSYLAAVGTLGDGIIERINKELKAKFGEAAWPVKPPAGWGKGALFAYAFLYRNLAFKNPFEDLEEPLLFISGETGTLADSFGIRAFSEHNKEHQVLADQLAVIDCRSNRDFILRLKSVEPDDDILLAMVKPEKTLRATLDAVRARVEQSGEKPIAPFDTVMVPKFDFDLEHSYGEIAAYLGSLAGGPAEAKQRVRFQLNEKGAVLASDARIYTLGLPKEPPKQMLFNRPFLIYLAHKGSRYPYMAMWVGSPELLVKAKPVEKTATGLPEARTLVANRCTVCHGLARVDQADYDPLGWGTVLDRMIKNGAKLDKRERVAVGNYLSLR